ncbi:MAG: CDP-diacylglycerol--glycerol-3-phosphate 3-phosphatidyltransferase [Elusimicrobia bacterium]|nr:CDP-diacylglycerol--glycerol-3-phosphate 3-phosphatidyltransferase [Elusimicrobiota bacterium]
MTLANQLTMLRMALAIIVFGSLMTDSSLMHLVALATFIAAVVTDWVDGFIARRTNTVSAFGKVADPIADKVLVLGALIALLRIPKLDIPLWGVFLIIARDLVIGGIRVLLSSQGKIMAADRWGKLKTGFQCGSVMGMIVLLAVMERAQVPAWVMRLPYILTVICVVMTWFSAVMYLRQSRPTLEKTWG